MGNVTEEITNALEAAQTSEFGQKDKAEYNKYFSDIKKGFKSASNAYVKIACAIWNVYHNEYYRIANYRNIVDWCEGLFEIKKSTTHNYIKVIERFGQIEDGVAKGIKEEFKNYLCSQLVAMSNYTPEQIEHINPDMSVREISAFGKGIYDIPVVSDSNQYERVEDDEDDDFSDLPVPAIDPGSIVLYESNDFHVFKFDFAKRQRDFLAAFEDMKNDKNYKNKNIKMVLSIVYE